MTRNRKGRVSEETFDDFLTAQGMLTSCEEFAVEELIAERRGEALEKQEISKVEMAGRMKNAGNASN